MRSLHFVSCTTLSTGNVLFPLLVIPPRSEEANERYRIEMDGSWRAAGLVRKSHGLVPVYLSLPTLSSAFFGNRHSGVGVGSFCRRGIPARDSQRVNLVVGGRTAPQPHPSRLPLGRLLPLWNCSFIYNWKVTKPRECEPRTILCLNFNHLWRIRYI